MMWNAFAARPLRLASDSTSPKTLPTLPTLPTSRRMAHGKNPKSSPCRQCKHDLHCPPLKYYIVRFCKVCKVCKYCKVCKVCKLHGRQGICCGLDGPRGGPSAEGHGSGGATNKIFYSPHCPHDPQIFLKIFVIFGTCLKAYLLHRARSKRLRRA